MSNSGGRGSGGKFTPPPGPGPLRRSGKGGGGAGDGSGGKSTPPMGKGGGSASTPPSGPTRQGSGDGGGQRPKPTPSETTFASIVNQAYLKQSKKKKTPSVAATSQASDADKSEKLAGQASDIAAQVTTESDKDSGQPSHIASPVATEEDRSTDSSTGKTVRNLKEATRQSSDLSAPRPTQSARNKSRTGQSNDSSSSRSAEKERATAQSPDPPAPVPIRNQRSTQPVSLVAGAQAPTKRDTLKALFKDFLENSGKNKESMGYYEALVNTNALSKDYVLKVNFKDLLKDKKYAELAMEIANDRNRDHEWLQQVAKDFLMRSFKEEDKSKLRLTFFLKPKSMQRLKSISRERLVRIVKLSHREDEVHVPTAFGRHVYLCVLLHILDCHEEGISYGGDFELGDVYILTYQNSLICWIAKETNWDGKVEISYLDRCTNEERVLDIHKVDEVVTRCYKDGDTLPLYFDCLSKNLQDVGVSYFKDKLWYMIYLRFHVALMSSMARKFLINELFLLMVAHKNESQVFTMLLQRWIRDLFDNGDPLLLAVYKYENPMYEDDNTTSGSATKGKATSTKKPSKQNATKGKEQKADRYDTKLGSALSYKRHLIWHTHNNIDNPNLLGDDEVELFAASNLPDVLPMLIEHLLSENHMLGRFAKLWSAYCAMRSDKEGETWI